jgi:tetratricopeptide (TPR) repeat protein
MAEGALSIKLRCASWQQLATIYKRDLSRGTMFLRAATPPAVGTAVHIDLTLPSATVIALEGVVGSHIQDPQRGAGVELTLTPLPASTVWLIETALASESKRLATPVRGVPGAAAHSLTGAIPIPTINENADVAAAENDLIKALVSEAESLRKLNPFLVLGVGYEAGDAEVRAAFGELTKRYHPDRFARYESAELRQLAAEIFILIRDAYRRLGDAAARAQVLQSLGKAAPAPRAVPAPRGPSPSVPPPPRATQRVPLLPPLPPPPTATLPISALPAGGPPAAVATSTGAPAAAAGPPGPTSTRPPSEARRTPSRRPASEPSLPAPPASTPSASSSSSLPAMPADRRPAPSQPPAVPSDSTEITALEELIDQGRLDEALAGYRQIAKRHPGDRNMRAGVELCEGLLALAARDRLEAAQRFETALEIDPSNERAARELAEMRRQATNERKGLLSRLMGKKEP